MNKSTLLLIDSKSNLNPHFISFNCIFNGGGKIAKVCCIALFLWLYTGSTAYAQNIKADAIEYTGIRSNCIMELNATNKALLLPRILNVATSISSPLRGMIVYDSTANRLSYYNGTAWTQLDGNNNIYTADGTVASPRTVTMGNNNLLFNSVNGLFVFNPTGTGKVGIGTTTPAAKLDVAGSVNASTGFYGAYGQTVLGVYGQTNTKLIDVSWTTTDQVNIYTPGGASNTAKISILGNGNVGIGTTTPAQKLDVAGTAKANNLILSNLPTGVNTDQVLVIDGSNNVKKVPAITSKNIYNSDDALTGDRIVSQNGKSLSFTGGTLNLNSTLTSNIIFKEGRDAIIAVNNTTGGWGSPSGNSIIIRAGSNSTGSNTYPYSGGGNLTLESGDGSGKDQNLGKGIVTAGDIYIRPGANVGGDLCGRVFLSPPRLTTINADGPFGAVAIGTFNAANNNFLTVKYASCDGTNWNNGSDRRLKQDIVPLSYGLKEILKLQPKFYAFKIRPNKREVGLIAQEVKDIIPELVGGEEGNMSEGKILTLNYANLTAVLVNAIQEQQQMIQGQQKAIELLQQEMAEIKKAIQRKP